MSTLRSIEQVLADEYPKKVTLRDGSHVVLRPLAVDDQEALIGLFRRIPSEEQGRFFRDPVTDPVVVAEWCNHIDPTETLAMVVVDGEKIVADGTIRCTTARMKQHVGELRLSVDPECRDRGVGSALVSHLLDLAPYLGLDWIDAEVSTNEPGALQFLEHMRFDRHGLMPDHAKDGLGGVFDVVLLSRHVGRDIAADIGGQG
jgi:GNAT superfamily N-acetyltransferase